MEIIGNPKILHLTLHKEWFDEIREGTKDEEFRIAKPYWVKRLRGKKFDVVHFRNGYSRLSPEMWVECLGIEEEEGYFVIKLGKIYGGLFTPEERLLYQVLNTKLTSGR